MSRADKNEGGRWRFAEMRPAEVNFNPVQGEFFTDQDIADRLVRETLQNSLDEPANPGEPVRVRFGFHDGGDALAPRSGRRYLKGLLEHLRTSEGVPPEAVALAEGSADIPFVVIEDFGTKGLVGDIYQYDDHPGKSAAGNNFYWFFRNVGRSGKGDESAGSWGLGKWVFPDASRINCFFAMTVRYDDAKRLLMGQAVLTKHTVVAPDRESRYGPYGFFAVADESGLPLPLMQDESIDTFSKDFLLERSSQPGLSLVIPFPHEALRAGDVMRAVIKYFYLAILMGDLTVEVQANQQEWLVDAGSIRGIIREVDWDRSGTSSEEMLHLCESAVWLERLPDESRMTLNLPDPGRSPGWDQAFDDAMLERMRTEFEEGRRLAIRAPIAVTRRNLAGDALEPVESFFDLMIEMDPQVGVGHDYYVRRKLAIPRMTRRLSRPIRAIVMVKDPPLAALLRDSEDPSHARWRPSAARVRDGYLRGNRTVGYVNRAVDSITQYLTRRKVGRDRQVLKNFFNIPVPPRGVTPPDPGGGGGTVGPIPRSPALYAVERRPAGFTVRGTPHEDRRPGPLAISVAYMVRTGNPLKKYHRADFDLKSEAIRLTATGARVEDIEKNRCRIHVDSPEFEVVFEGFHAARDLFVSAVEEKGN